MSTISVREFNSNVSKALAQVRDGHSFDITRNGEIFAEVRPKRQRRADDPTWVAAFESLMDDLDEGVPFGRRFDHDERNG